MGVDGGKLRRFYTDRAISSSLQSGKLLVRACMCASQVGVLQHVLASWQSLAGGMTANVFTQQ